MVFDRNSDDWLSVSYSLRYPCVTASEYYQVAQTKYFISDWTPFIEPSSTMNAFWTRVSARITGRYYILNIIFKVSTCVHCKTDKWHAGFHWPADMDKYYWLGSIQTKYRAYLFRI